MWPAQHAAEIKKATGRSAVTLTQRAEMTSASINDLPDSDFAYIEPGGSKDTSGRTVPRDKRHFPVHDAPHVRDALGRAPQSPFGDKAMPKIKAAAKRLGVDVSDSSSSPSGGSRAEYMRLYPLEDMHIIRSADGGDGRTVEAFAAVFDDPAEIQDFEGHYVETIDRAAFNKVIADASRARGGFPGSVKVLYNHGMTIQGTPSERFSMPIGVPVRVDHQPVVHRPDRPLRPAAAPRRPSPPRLRRDAAHRPPHGAGAARVRPGAVARILGRRDPRCPHVHSRCLGAGRA
jgi:hypothetical protein